jgi:hypothetical protein
LYTSALQNYPNSLSYTALVKVLLITLLLTLQLGWAQMDCEGLITSIETAFEQAVEVIMSTQIMQGNREFAYSRIRLYKEGDAWQSETLEERGVRRPNTAQSDDGAEPSFAFDCTEHTLSTTAQGWRLEITEQNDDLPIDRWQLEFTRSQGVVVPLSVSGQFEARILLIPFRGTFVTSFAGWRLNAP